MASDTLGRLAYAHRTIVGCVAAGRVTRWYVCTGLRTAQALGGTDVLSTRIVIVAVVVKRAAVIDRRVDAGVVQTGVCRAQVKVVAIFVRYAAYRYLVVLTDIPRTATVDRTRVSVVAGVVLNTAIRYRLHGTCPVVSADIARAWISIIAV